MTCKDCDAAHEEPDYYPYRWKIATVIVIGCRLHVGEIFEALSIVQERKDDESG